MGTDADDATADDASRYRSADELADAWNREPIDRLRNYLLERGAWSKAQEEALIRSCTEQVQEAAEAYLAHPAPDVDQMFDCLYATLPEAYAQQRKMALSAAQDHGTDHAG